MKTSEIFALDVIKELGQVGSVHPGVDVEFRYVAIPQDGSRNKTKDMFNKEYMTELEELGRKMGADPSSWRTKVPSPYWYGEE